VNWYGTGYSSGHYTSIVLGVGQLVYVVFAAFEILVARADLGDVAVAPCRLQGGWSVSAGNGDGEGAHLGSL